MNLVIASAAHLPKASASYVLLLSAICASCLIWSVARALNRTSLASRKAVRVGLMNPVSTPAKSAPLARAKAFLTAACASTARVDAVLVFACNLLIHLITRVVLVFLSAYSYHGVVDESASSVSSIFSLCALRLLSDASFCSLLASASTAVFTKTVLFAPRNSSWARASFERGFGAVGGAVGRSGWMRRARLAGFCGMAEQMSGEVEACCM